MRARRSLTIDGRGRQATSTDRGGLYGQRCPHACSVRIDDAADLLPGDDGRESGVGHGRRHQLLTCRCSELSYRPKPARRDRQKYYCIDATAHRDVASSTPWQPCTCATASRCDPPRRAPTSICSALWSSGPCSKVLRRGVIASASWYEGLSLHRGDDTRSSSACCAFLYRERRTELAARRRKPLGPVTSAWLQPPKYNN